MGSGSMLPLGSCDSDSSRYFSQQIYLFQRRCALTAKYIISTAEIYTAADVPVVFLALHAFEFLPTREENCHVLDSSLHMDEDKAPL